MRGPRSPALPRRDAGLSLIEVLVTLAVIGVVAGLSVLALPGPRTEPAALREADLLAARLTMAADDALASSARTRLRWDADGYGFEQAVEGGWGPHRLPALAGRHALPGDGRLGDAGALTIWPDLRPPEGGTVTFAIGAAGDGTARVVFDGLGARVEDGR